MLILQRLRRSESRSCARGRHKPCRVGKQSAEVCTFAILPFSSRRAATRKIIPGQDESLTIHLPVFDGIQHRQCKLPALYLVDLRRTECASRRPTTGLDDALRCTPIIGCALLACIEHINECEYTLPARPTSARLGVYLCQGCARRNRHREYGRKPKRAMRQLHDVSANTQRLKNALALTLAGHER